MTLSYKPSGKFSPLSLIYLAIGCITIIPLAALLYAQATIALLSIGIVFVIVNVIVAAIFGALVGGLVMDVAVIGWGRVRNVPVATVLGAIAGLVAYYWHWVFWLQQSYYTEDTAMAIFQTPVAVRAAIRDLIQTGTITLDSKPVTGFWLLLIWLIEMAIIVFSPIILARKKAMGPFSEKRGKWAKEIKLTPFEYIGPEDAEKIRAGDFSTLFSLQTGNKLSHHSLVTLHDGFGDWYVSIEDKFASEEKGKVKFEETKLLEYAVIDSTLANYLQNPNTPELESDMPKEPETSAQPKDAYHEMYNTEKTKIVAGLLEIPKDQRTDEWNQHFHSNILQASFTCGSPQVVQGPDGLPYFMLQYPESKKPFNPFSLVSIKDHVLKNGYGVALSPDGRQIIWSIPHGAMVNLHLNGELFTQPDHSNLPEREVLKEETQVYYGQPSEEYLPSTTREALKDFLQTQGIQDPQVTLMLRERPEGPSTELVFNIFPEDFESEQRFEALMRHVQWFLPQHYVIVVVPKEPELAENLVPL